MDQSTHGTFAAPDERGGGRPTNRREHRGRTQVAAARTEPLDVAKMIRAARLEAERPGWA